MSVDPNILAVVTWAGQLFEIYGGALILIGALTVIGYFYPGKGDKKLKQNSQTLELLVSGKANTDARIGELEKTVTELARRADGIKATIGDEDQHPGEG